MAQLLYNKDLANRFVKDYKLPIQLTDEKYFFYFLDLYEDKFLAKTKYTNLCQLIEDRFESSPILFLNEYYNIRNQIILSVENSDAYIQFNTMPMDKFSVPKRNITSNDVYNETNIGKWFVSFDLKKANFQALKYVDSNIVLNTSSYEKFIKKFTDIDYIAESKYTRQVLFGKLNPKRQITVEKFIINEIYEYITKNFKMSDCVSLSQDEIVFKIDDKFTGELSQVYYLCNYFYTITQCVLKELGFQVKCELYKLYDVRLSCDKFERSAYYLKDTYFFNEAFKTISNSKTLMKVPMNYYAIVYKLLNGMELQEEDYHFDYEGLDCKYCENFHIETTFKSEE